MKKLVCLLLALLMVLPVAVFGVFADTGAAPAMQNYDLSSFKIVCTDSHLTDLATTLKNKISTASGIELEIVTTVTEDTGANEFIIGATNREISATCLDFSTFEYKACAGVFCDNGKVQLLGGDRSTIRSSINYFVQNLLEESTSISLAVEGALCEEIDLDKVGIPEKEDDSYIRVISNNILMQSYTDDPDWNRPETEDRMALLVGAYVLLDADIIGFQECDALWETREGMIEKLGALGYSKVELASGRNNGPIYYKTDRFEVLASGATNYDTTDKTLFPDGPYEARSYTWACLEEKATGKQIIIANTHLVWGWGNYDGASAQAFAYRNESARQLVAFTEAMKTEYPEAVSVVMGDLNSRLDSDVCKILGEGLKSARDTAEKKNNMRYDSDMNIATKPPQSKNPKVIDHIYYSKTGAVAKYYEVNISPYTYSYSDHVPVIVDFLIGEEKEEESATEEVTTEEVTTEVPATEVPTTEVLATEAPTTDVVEEEGGCGSTVGIAGLALVAALGTCTVLAAKKKED